MCRWWTSTFENSSGCTTLDMPDWRETTEQIDWRAKLSSQVTCFSEELKCWEAWDTTCGHKAKDITPLIAWRREAWKEEALDGLPWKNRERHRQSDEHFNRFKGNIGETSERRGGAHMGFFESTHTILNWTIGQYHSDTPSKQRWNTADAEIEVFFHCELTAIKDFSFSPGEGQRIALHVFPTAKNYFACWYTANRSHQPVRVQKWETRMDIEYL